MGAAGFCFLAGGPEDLLRCLDHEVPRGHVVTQTHPARLVHPRPCALDIPREVIRGPGRLAVPLTPLPLFMSMPSPGMPWKLPW